jgi:FkbM family methyltransferase
MSSNSNSNTSTSRNIRQDVLVFLALMAGLFIGFLSGSLYGGATSAVLGQLSSSSAATISSVEKRNTNNRLRDSVNELVSTSTARVAAAAPVTAIAVDETATTTPLLGTTPPARHSAEVDCTTIPQDDAPNDQEVHLVDYNDTKVMLDVAWWQRNKDPQLQISQKEDHLMDLIFQETLLEELLIDVGSNVGKYSMLGLVTGRETYAFDPLEFNAIKQCHAIQKNILQGFASQENAKHKYHYFRAAVGDEDKDEIDISRPEDKFGKFDQASMLGNTIGVVTKPKLVIEKVPMLTLDTIIPDEGDSKPIGLVKIDVQGVELLVVKGMTKILSRDTGYPTIIHYEEQKRVTEKGGIAKMGEVQEILEGYGYTCARHDRNDIDCRKPRK